LHRLRHLSASSEMQVLIVKNWVKGKGPSLWFVSGVVDYRDCNPGLEFSIPGFGIVEFPIPGSRRDWSSTVKTTKIATWATVFGSLFLNYRPTSVYHRAMDLVLMCCKPCHRNILLQHYVRRRRRPYKGKSTSDLSKSR